MLKRDLRLSHLQLRDKFSKSDVLLKSKDIFRWSLSAPIWDLKTFHVFLSISHRREVDTSALIAYLKQLGKKIAVPKIIGRGLMESYALDSDTVLVENSWGIPEPTAGKIIDPQQIDVVFVPLLAYDIRGHRAGYGGGFYDRFIAKCRKETLLVGLSFFPPAEDLIDIEPTDVPLDYCITPEGIRKF